MISSPFGYGSEDAGHELFPSGSNDQKGGAQQQDYHPRQK
jgi:hypothetical protein